MAKTKRDMAKTESDVLELRGAWPKPYVMRPRIALKIKSVDYKFVSEIPESESQHAQQSNPVRMEIPALVHKGKTIHNHQRICESLIIVEYIDEAWSSGPSILPSDPYDRAIARSLAAYLDDKWFPNFKKLPMKMRGTSEVEETSEAENQIVEGLKLLEKELKRNGEGKVYFGGDKIGYLDIAFGSYLSWLRGAEKYTETKLLNEANTPALVKWAQTFSCHPAVKGLIPDTDKLIALAKSVTDK